MSENKGTRVVSHEVMDGGVAFTVRDAVKGEGGIMLPGTLVLTFASLSEEVKQQAMVHGLVQRVSDRAAISRDASTGKSASPEDKFNAMKALVDHYNSGSTSWNLAGGERGPSDEIKLLIEALCGVYPQKTAEDITTWVRKRTKAEVAGLLAQENIKARVEALRAERAKGVDAEALLSELA